MVSRGACDLVTLDSKTASYSSLLRRLASNRPAMTQPRNRLHGITLEQLLIALVERIGWEAMGAAVPIRCFDHDPSIASSLKLLRRTPWARVKVEGLYLQGVAGR